MGARALVLDFGGPVLLTPFELVGDRRGTPVHELLFGRGPLATVAAPDLDWTALQEGRITERAYWAHRAREWHGAGGSGPDISAMMAHLYEPARPQLVREQARTLIRDARAAGHPVAILTNDLRAFHSQEWVDEIEIVGDVDVLVDGSVEGYLKPDRRLYEILADRLGVDFVDMVFLDDQMTNIRGAQALGIPSVWFDPAVPDAGFDAVRILLGLPEEEPHG
ncbi:HAD-IA family hydrolase [Blastococcus jejuensis]|uniref:HAD-IA family hydrolase n=1 Tax=Blastococcus jejuensis TaxID=351224 RepID=A0ABP6P038_9ACTN